MVDWVWRESDKNALKKNTTESLHTKWMGRRAPSREIAVDAFDLRTKRSQYLSHYAWSKREVARRRAERAIKKAKEQEQALKNKQRQKASLEAYQKWKRRATCIQKCKNKDETDADKNRHRGTIAHAQWTSRAWRQDMGIAHQFRPSQVITIIKNEKLARAIVVKLQLRSWLHRWRRGVAIAKWLRKKKREHACAIDQVQEELPHRRALAERERQLWRQKEWRHIMRVDLRPSNHQKDSDEDQLEYAEHLIQREKSWQLLSSSAPCTIQRPDSDSDPEEEEQERRRI